MKALEQGKTVNSSGTTQRSPDNKDQVACDRCGKAMFRMRAVYWCEHCGYKTDCCGS